MRIGLVTNPHAGVGTHCQSLEWLIISASNRRPCCSFLKRRNIASCKDLCCATSSRAGAAMTLCAGRCLAFVLSCACMGNPDSETCNVSILSGYHGECWTRGRWTGMCDLHIKVTVTNKLCELLAEEAYITILGPKCR